MAETSNSTTPTKATLGLTGLTSNAMALIAPGAFLWLTFGLQSLTGAPGAGMSMWFGILLALLLCLATAVAYAELSKLYPGAGSSYFFAEQAFLSKRQAFKWARLSKFIVGWASHLYYWVYPGVMVGVTALLAGFILGQFFPDTFNPAIPSPIFMFAFCIVFAFGVAYIAFRGVGGTTGVNAAINVIQIVALVIFAVMAIAHRVHFEEGSTGAWAMDSTGNLTRQVQAVDDKGNPKVDDAGTAVMTKETFVIHYSDGIGKNDQGQDTYDYHPNATSVVAPHNFSFVVIQACVAILILVGFESVTAMGEEAKNAKRDIPRAVLLSLIIQGGFCYALQYFAANYFMHSGYKDSYAAARPAPVGDMMLLVGAWAFNSPVAGWWFMMVQAFSVFLALIGTTLSCLSTGARVTYAMGRDNEVSGRFGKLHGSKATPHRAIWMLAAISAVIGMIAVAGYFCGGAAAADSDLQALRDKHPFLYGFGLIPHDTAAQIPQSMLIVTLVSNFGTFLLYMMTCIVAIVAFREHHTFSGFKHMVVPVFGLLANLLCMAFYLIGPLPGVVSGMSWKEPYTALGVAFIWGLYGAFHFLRNSKKTGKSILVAAPEAVPA